MNSRNFKIDSVSSVLRNPRTIFILIIGTIIYIFITLFDGIISYNVLNISSIPFENAVESFVSLILLSILNSFILISIVNVVKNFDHERITSDRLNHYGNFIRVLILTLISTVILSIAGLFPILFSIYIYNTLSMFLSFFFYILIVIMIIFGVFFLFTPISVVFRDLSISESFNELRVLSKKISLTSFIIGILPLGFIYTMVYIFPIVSYLFTYPLYIITVTMFAVIYSKTFEDRNMIKNFENDDLHSPFISKKDGNYNMSLDHFGNTDNSQNFQDKNVDLKLEDVKLYPYYIKRPFKILKKIEVDESYSIDDNIHMLKKMAFDLGANAVTNVRYHKKFYSKVSPKFSGLAVYINDIESVERYYPYSNTSIVINGLLLFFSGVSRNLSGFIIMPLATFILIYITSNKYGFSSIILKFVTSGIIIFNMWLIYIHIDSSNPYNNINSLWMYCINLVIIGLTLVYLYNMNINENKFDSYMVEH